MDVGRVWADQSLIRAEVDEVWGAGAGTWAAWAADTRDLGTDRGATCTCFSVGEPHLVFVGATSKVVPFIRINAAQVQVWAFFFPFSFFFLFLFFFPFSFFYIFLFFIFSFH